jgi:hypothetical protein
MLIRAVVEDDLPRARGLRQPKAAVPLREIV